MVGAAGSELAAIVFLALKIRANRYFDPTLVSIVKIREMIGYSWPMVPNNLSNWVLKMSDRLVITSFLGIEANAVYAVANKIPNLLSIAQSILIMAWQENASIAVKDHDADQYFSKMFNLIFTLMIGINAVLIGFTPYLFKLLIKGDYGEAYFQIPLLNIGMFFYVMSAFLGGIYIAHKKTKSIGITTMIAAVINLVIDFLFVNRIGITAGSLSTLIAYLVLYIYRTHNVSQFQPMDFHIRKQLCLYLISGVMLVICYIHNTYLDIFNCIFGIVLFFALNKTVVMKIFGKMKKTARQR